jgi:hypothetical protein
MATSHHLIAPTWIPPTGDHVKINVAGAIARIENHGVVAPICRSADGHFMGASALACMCFSDPVHYML